MKNFQGHWDTTKREEKGNYLILKQTKYIFCSHKQPKVSMHTINQMPQKPAEDLKKEGNYT